MMVRRILYARTHPCQTRSGGEIKATVTDTDSEGNTYRIYYGSDRRHDSDDLSYL